MPRKTPQTDPLSASVPLLGEAIRDSAQQIWLAGLGAFNKAQAEGSKAFEALVQDGLSLQRKSQAAAEEKVAEATKKVSSLATDLGARAGAPWDKLENIFEDRVAKALQRLGIPSVQDFNALKMRLDELDKKIQVAPARPRRAGARTAGAKPKTPPKTRT